METKLSQGTTTPFQINTLDYITLIMIIITIIFYFYIESYPTGKPSDGMLYNLEGSLSSSFLCIITFILCIFATYSHSTTYGIIVILLPFILSSLYMTMTLFSRSTNDNNSTSIPRQSQKSNYTPTPSSTLKP